ncbi:MAG: outer membrane beta-barrel protein [Prevotella sp.]|nr:outer membrane beta-barrel protein [Prevotella sp.]
MTHQILITFMVCMGCFTAVHARHLTGRVIDPNSDEAIPGVTVELLQASDSSLIRSVVTADKEFFGRKMAFYDIDVDNNTTYILRFSMVGFKIIYKRVDVRMAERVNEQFVDDVRLEEDSKVLDEVVVKATKIKMVMKGDTVVYDASAFSLSQGSMLDALIRQMPGTTLENGVIKVNGRTVSSLLIDGRDFFKGDAKKALENLPAYTVDKVKAYDKRGKESRLMGRDMNDKEFVLDVGLKKEYQHGMMANVDLAAGTDHRYGSKLFSMVYTKRSRLTLVGSMNNINDREVPGEDASYRMRPDMGGGLTATRMAGLTYRYEGKTEDDYIETEATFNSTDNETETRTTSQTFLTGGDYFGLSRNGNRNKNTAFAWKGSFGLTPGRHMLDGSISIDHSKSKGWGNSLSGRFNANPASFASLDSLFRPDAGHELLAMTINRVRNDNKNNGENTGYSLNLNERFRFGSGDSWDNMLYLNGNMRYSEGKNYRYDLNAIDYLGNTPSEDHRNQYSTTPNKDYNLYLSAAYTRLFKCDTDEVNTIFIRPTYRFNQTYSSVDYSLHRLDQLQDYTDSAYTLGVLPSTREALLQVLDTHNSYRSREHNMTHAATLTTSFIHGDGTRMPRIAIDLSLPAEVRREKLEYYRQQSYTKSRTSLLFNPSIDLTYHFNDSTGTRYLSFSYNTNQSQPSLTTLLDIRDDANPLLVTLGNPNLKKARTHSLNLQGGIFHMRMQRLIGFGLNYNATRNAIATSTLYDKESGKTTTQQVNVNGNWNMGGNFVVSTPLDKRQRLSMQQYFTANYNNNVDLTTVEGTQAVRSNVHNWSLSENLSFQYQIGEKLRVHINGSATYQQATSTRQDFQNVHAWNYSVGTGGEVQLPWSMELSTDLVDYNRRGYNDEQMNTSELVWNARLSKKMMQEKLVLSLDGFDILGNLSNTSFTLNEQGRTETWTHSLTRYLMLHLSYKFNLGMKSPRGRRYGI